MLLIVCCKFVVVDGLLLRVGWFLCVVCSLLCVLCYVLIVACFSVVC